MTNDDDEISDEILWEYFWSWGSQHITGAGGYWRCAEIRNFSYFLETVVYIYIFIEGLIVVDSG